MDALTTGDLLTAMNKARFDPAGQQREILNKVELITGGAVRYVEPTSPFIFLLEAACCASAGALAYFETLDRKRFPSLALTKEDLYLHMSDRDYLGIFASPPEAPIGITVSLEEVKKYAVQVTSGGMRKLTLPKNSNFTVDGHTFTMEYPIEFRIMPNGGLSVVYGSPAVPALHEIGSNLLTWDIVNYGDTPMIRVFTQIKQQAITSQVFQTNAASVFSTKLPFTDQFHYARAFVRTLVNGVSGWKEIKTTHTDQVFDPNTATLLLQVNEGVLEVTAPLIYRNNGLINGEVRIDIYTTKATNDKILSDYDASAWTINWEDLDNEDAGKYTSNFSLLSTYAVFSDGYTSGATAALTLEELRDRVMNHNVGPINLPITNVNYQRAMADLGYSSVTDVDVVTKRVLNAVRPMSLPVDGYTLTPISCASETMILRLDDLVGLDGASHNGNRVTLHPSVLYKDVDGGVSIVGQDEILSLRALKPEAMAQTITDSSYRFSPLHYVLDATNNNFAMRAYYLDAPEVTARQFILENPSVQLDVKTGGTLAITRTATGYQIHLQTNSGDTYKGLSDDQVHVQLAYYPPGETNQAFLNGTLVTKTSSGERVWEFDLRTNYDIDANHSLILNNFAMFNDGPLNHPIDLETTFDILYLVSGYSVQAMKESAIDQVKNRNLLPYDSIGVLQEQATIRLGSSLEYLWTGSRTIVTPESYQTYTTSIPELYEAPEFETDTDGGIKVTNVNGQLQATIIHNVGDPKLDALGNPVYKVTAGDFIVDEQGNKKLKAARQLARQVDLTLFDGRYYFANDPQSIAYMKQVCTSLLSWCNTDMANSNETALEKTLLYFRPLASLGKLTVVVGEGTEVTIDAEQAMKVSVGMTEAEWKNEDLKNNIRKAIITIIAEAFTRQSIAVKDMVTAISEQASTGVLGVDLSGMGGAKNYTLMTMKDNNGRPSIRKKLVAKADGTFTVEEDIEVAFYPHLPAKSQK